MAEYKQSKQYLKLSKSARKVLDDYVSSGKKRQLFKDIKENVATQNTLKSRHTRQSIFRGLLRKYFDFTDEHMKPIAFTEDEKQNYFDSNQQGLQQHRETTINAELIDKIIKIHPLCYLMVTSGRRAGELLDNDVKFDDGKVFMKLNKKRDTGVWYPIHILGSLDHWKTIYEQVKNSKKSSISIINSVNVGLKHIIPKAFYKRSSHICRAIYIRYIYQYHNPNNKTLPYIIQKYLHHESGESGAYYHHVVLDDDVPKDMFGDDDVEDYNKMKVGELKALAKEKGLTGYSKLRKNELVELLLNR